MEAVLDFLINIYNVTVAYLLGVYGNLEALYTSFCKNYNISIPLDFMWVLVIVLAIIIAIIVIVAVIISLNKRRKIVFYNGKERLSKIKLKYKELITFPEVTAKEGETFVVWFSDKKLKKPFLMEVLPKRKNYKLYAKFEKGLDGGDAQTISFINFTKNESQLEDRVEVIEEKIEFKETHLDIGDIYDSIRYEMLSYERAQPFKQLGVVRKQVVAEMFEKDGKINLYFAVDPILMKEKGYNVEVYSEPEFQIVPCKKVVESYADYDEVVNLIKEAMLLNNFVKSDVVMAQKVKSDESIRKSGFAFYVKNDIIATSASEYYILLRAVVLSYKLSALRKYPESLDNKMILKIFKKDERVFLYLSLNADAEGLEFVGYDKNFQDTPAMFEVKTADDCVKAQSLIDKLMYRYGMEKYPEQAEISLSDEIETNCGFGYRIRR